MGSALVALALSGLGRAALKAALTLTLAILIVVAFTISSVVVVIEGLALAVGGAPPSLGGPVAASPTGRDAAVLALARNELGMPYVWGGASPATSFDCSGLVQWVYGNVGVTLPRTAQDQYDATDRVDPSQLQPGDLVFFAGTDPSDPSPITHVGIYVGGGQMIDAPDVGEVVTSTPVFTGYWGSHFAGGGRVPE